MFSSESTPTATSNKEDKRITPKDINLKNIKKYLESDEVSLEGLKNPKLEKRKVQLEKDEVNKFIVDVAQERKLKREEEVKNQTAQQEETKELSTKYAENDDEKRAIPLLRVHNTLLTPSREQTPRPVITYYRVNGNPGRLEESFKIVSGTNKSSIYGVGATYEDY